MIKEIENRRSIRKYTKTAIPEQDILEIIAAAVKAPSAKNRQPWKFIVIQGQAKTQMLEAFRKGIQREESGTALLPNSRQHIAAAKHTVDIIEQAPVTIFIINTGGAGIFTPRTPEEQIYELANIQSISAAIQNMLITAEEKGLGSLWICDIFFAYEELCQWVNTNGELIAAVALGVPAETPAARPRKTLNDVVVWKK